MPGESRRTSQSERVARAFGQQFKHAAAQATIANGLSDPAAQSLAPRSIPQPQQVAASTGPRCQPKHAPCERMHKPGVYAAPLFGPQTVRPPADAVLHRAGDGPVSTMQHASAAAVPLQGIGEAAWQRQIRQRAQSAAPQVTASAGSHSSHDKAPPAKHSARVMPIAPSADDSATVAAAAPLVEAIELPQLGAAVAIQKGPAKACPAAALLVATVGAAGHMLEPDTAEQHGSASQPAVNGVVSVSHHCNVPTPGAAERTAALLDAQALPQWQDKTTDVQDDKAAAPLDAAGNTRCNSCPQHCSSPLT
jgi:hypothetical protein